MVESIKPIGQIQMSGSLGAQAAVGGSTGHPDMQLDEGSHSGVSFDAMPGAVTIESSVSGLRIDAIARPAWANRIWCDRFGIACEFRVSDVPFVLRWIPPGEFLMGSPENENGRFADDAPPREGPRHTVTITNGFWMGETPVTRAQWAAVVKEGNSDKKRSPVNSIEVDPSYFKDSEQLPVERVSWDMCNLFIEVLNRLIPCDWKFQLPTEAEWEYACRAGTQTAFHDGSDCTRPQGNDPSLAKLGWFYDNSDGKTHSVKEKLPNQWGLFDMHGNVWEWCRDGNRDYTEETQLDPLGTLEKGAYRISRGGSWHHPAAVCRAAYRDLNDPASRWGNDGFRLSAAHEPESGAD